jgi:hypothetical protein
VEHHECLQLFYFIENCTSVALIILDINHRPIFLFKTRLFGHWIVCSSPGGPNEKTSLYLTSGVQRQTLLLGVLE